MWAMGLAAGDPWPPIERHRALDVNEATGRFETFNPRPGLHVTRARGHLTQNMAARWIGSFDHLLDDGSIYACLHHWRDVTGYDSLARKSVTSWAVRRAGSFSEVTLLFESRLVAMAIATVNLATARSGLVLRGVTRPDEWNARLVHHLRAR